MGHVLIVEDDKFLSKIYATKLQKEGLEADFAHDGMAGLEKMKKKKPALVLLDIIMPRLDGFGVLEAMRSDKDLKKVPVIILSNLGQEEDIERAKEFGVRDFIVKSDASIQDVVKKIKAHL